MVSIFISYGRDDDEPFVKRLSCDLRESGFEVWWDRVSMPGRALTFLQEIRDAITFRDRLVLIVGPDAVRSDYVRAEWQYALSICKPVNPVLRLGGYDSLPEELKLFDAPNFCDDAHYGASLETLLRQLNEPVAPLGKLIAVPELPPHFLPRPGQLKAIEEGVLADVNRPVVVTGTARRTGVQGMAGIGKSVLATALARDCEVRHAFPDGVLWVALGQEPALTSRQSQLCKTLGDSALAFEDVQQGRARLSELLRDKACLVILDDVWHAKHAEAFDTLGPRCRMLITTRDASLIAALGAVDVRLEVLSDAQALKLLAEWLGQAVETLPAEAHDVARECGNLPLALAMIGAMVRGKPNRWSNVLHKLRNADLAKVRQEFPNYPYPDLLRAIQVSVEALEPEVQARYLDFAVFPEDTPITESVLQTFWEAEELNRYDMQDVVDTLVDRSLAQRDKEGRLSLHDLLLDYVRAQAGDLLSLHNRLLNAYAAHRQNGWSTGPNDGYFFKYLPYHLLKARRYEELFAVARDRAFLTAQTESLPGDPYLSLGTIQTAIAGASQIDDAARMAEFTLAHAQRLMALRSESPLSFLRAGDPERARKVADLNDIERCVLWHLLLAWAADCGGRREEARATLERLREKALPRLSSGWQAGYAVALLALVRNVSEDSLIDLQRRLLDEQHQRSLCERLANLGSPCALNAARLLETESHRAAALQAIAETQLKAGQSDAGRAVFAEAVQAARGIELPAERAEALKALARAQAEAGQSADAFATASGIDSEFGRQAATIAVAAVLARGGDVATALAAVANVGTSERDEVLAAVAEAQARAGDFSGALETALGIDVAIPRANVLEMIALAQVEVGGLGPALRTVAEIDWLWRRLRASVREGTLAAVAQAQARAGDFVSARESAEGVTQTLRRDDVLNVIAEAQARAGDIAAALETVRIIRYDHTREEALKTIIRLQACAENFESALQIARGLDESGRAEALAAIAEEQARAGAFAGALETAQQLDESQELPGVMAAVAALQAEAGDRDGACETFGRARDLSNTIVDERGRAESLASIAGRQEQAGWRDAARTRLADAFEIARQIGEPVRRAETLSAIVRTHLKAGDFADALDVASSIQRGWYLAEALKEIAQAQAASGAREAARATFERAFQASVRNTGGWTNPVGIVEATAEAGELEAALQSALAIPDEQQRWEAVSRVAMVLARAGEIEAGMAVVNQIGQAKAAAEALIVVASAQARTGDFTAAFKTAQAIGEQHQRARAIAAVVEAQAAAGDYAAALETAREIEPEWTWAEALVKIAAAMAAAGRPAEALAVAEEVDRARELAEAHAAGRTTGDAAKVRAPRDVDLCDRRLKAIAAVQARAREFADALRTAGEIKLDWTRSEARRLISAAQARAGDFEAARETAGAISRDVERVAALKSIALSQLEAGKREAGRATLAEAALSAKHISDGYHRNEALKELARSQAEAGELDDAIRTAGFNVSEDSRFASLADIAERQAAAGYLDAAQSTMAIALSATIPEPESERWRAAALATIARCQAQAGDCAAGLELAERVRDDHWAFEAFKGVAMAQAKAGMPGEARRTFEAAKKLALRADEGWWRSNQLRRLAESQLEAGELAEALATARSIPMLQEERRDALVAVVKAYAGVGDFATASRIIKDIDGTDSTWGALATARCMAVIAAAQAASGDRAKAQSTFDAALKAAREMGGDGWRMKALKAVAEAQAEVGEVGHLAQIAHAIIGSKSMRAEALGAIGEAHAKVGDDSAAQSTFSAALAVARGMGIKEERDEGERLSALMSIAAAQARAGDVDAALRVAEEVPRQFMRDLLLGEIVVAQARAGELGGALKTASMIEGDFDKTTALRDVAVAQAEAGLGAQAVETAEKIVGHRDEQLHEIGEALAEREDGESFKRLLIPCSFYPQAAYRMCGLLARLYPAQATAIAQMIQDDHWSEAGIAATRPG